MIGIQSAPIVLLSNSSIFNFYLRDFNWFTGYIVDIIDILFKFIPFVYSTLVSIIFWYFDIWLFDIWLFDILSIQLPTIAIWFLMSVVSNI